jgi:hypothetical protein
MHRIAIIAAFLLGSLVIASDRGGDWPMARMAYIRNHPTCEACGAVDDPSVHHIRSVDDGGTNEPANLITLCDPHEKGEDRENGCHWIVGHLASGWHIANPQARKQAAAMLRRSTKKATT